MDPKELKQTSHLFDGPALHWNAMVYNYLIWLPSQLL